MTMTESLVKLLKKQWVTPLDALQKANCLSLSQRCGELERAGVAIVRAWHTTDTGKRVRKYRIARG